MLPAEPVPPGTAPSAKALVDPEPKEYTPSEADQGLLALVENAYQRGRTHRRSHEPQWFVNSAMERGQQYVEWSVGRGLVVPPAPTHRIRLTINLIQPILRTRASKFLKARPIALAVPATSDIKDRQNARFTTKALDYQTRRLRIEAKYADCVRYAQLTGHGYLWLYWDPTIPGRVKVKDPLTQQASLETVAAGDIGLEVDGPWSLLVADPGIHFIGDQPWILRLKVRPLDYIRSRFQQKGKFVGPDTTADDALRYEQQIATLNAQGTGSAGLSEMRETGSQDGQAQTGKTHVLVKEYFERPCPAYPKGRYLVVASGVLLTKQDELPYGFATYANPYPVVDFPDLPKVGQYWITTVCEQLIPPQKEYNLLRSKLAEHLRLLVHPKILVAKQHQILAGAWTSEAGELIEYFAVPHLPPPTPWHPPPIAADTWKSLELLRKEMSDIAHVYPESEGQIGGATSGFQTNLLQEAVDAVHQPDVDAHGRILEELYYKLRRLMKLGYSLDRLITVAGRDLEPEAFEFSSEQIDDEADLMMVASSMLPKLPTAKAQMILELWKAGVYGMADDPEARRKVAMQLEMGTVEDTFSDARKDEQQAKVENDLFLDGSAELPIPEFYENHDLHYRIHTDLLKSPRKWDPNQKRALLGHLILHIKFQNPQSAVQLAIQYGMPELVADLLGPAMGAPAPPGPGGMAAPAPPSPLGVSPPPPMPGMEGMAGPADFPAPASPGPQAMPGPPGMVM